MTMQVNKVGLKLRAAIITEVYRKALSVNFTTLSKFSTGQVHIHCACVHVCVLKVILLLLDHVVHTNISRMTWVW